MLVPEPADALTGEVDKAKVRKAFELLRNDKGTSYGDTSIKISGRVPSRATATVRIDPDYSKYKLIIMAETVYTLTELGVDDIRFPGFAEGSVGREDIPFSAYTVTIPLWRAVPPGNFVDARIRLPDGDLLEYDEFERRWGQKDSDLLEALFAYLDVDQNYTVVSTAKRLPKLDISYAEEVIPLLGHESRSVRKAALKVLANKRDRQDVLEAVVDLMQNEENDKLATRAAEFLGKADSDKYSVFKQFFYLSRGTEKQKVQAAKQLSDKRGDERVVDALAKALRSKSARVGAAAAESLLSIDANDDLEEALDDGDVSGKVRMQVAEGLAEKSDDDAKISGLVYIGENAEGHDALVAVRSLGDVGTANAREAVESFLTNDDRKVRLAAAETVEKIRSTDSLEAVADAVRKGKNATRIEEAGFRILKEESLQSILEFTRHSDSVVQRMAYRALGPKAASGAGGSAVFKTLKKGASHSDDQIRGAAARALGAYANKDALAVLKKLADDSAAAVRRDVAHALGNYSGGEMVDKLTSYLDDDSPEVAAAALSSLAERNEAHAWKKIKSLAQSEHAIVRKHALIALSELVSRDDKETVRKVISMLSGIVTSDDNAGVIRTALQQLGTFNKERAVNGIAIMLNAKERDMRLTAMEALAKTGHESAVELISDVLADPDAEIRRAAIVALGKIGEARAIPKLKQRLQSEKDPELEKLIEKTINEL